jgi:hypothetical protein
VTEEGEADAGPQGERVVVLVDALNVLRSQWPNLPPAQLVERCTAWARAGGHAALVVFDGAPPLAHAAPDDGTRICAVVGTRGESADDWIARRASALAEQGRAYWLVTSDRELRRRAGAHAARQIGGGSFLRELLGSADRGQPRR